MDGELPQAAPEAPPLDLTAGREQWALQLRPLVIETTGLRHGHLLKELLLLEGRHGGEDHWEEEEEEEERAGTTLKCDAQRGFKWLGCLPAKRFRV